MNKIIGMWLVGLLGFFGCGGSDDGTSTAIGEAYPVAPFGIIETPSPTYEWTPVPWATKYRLLVQDTSEASTILDAQETCIIDEWYTAEESGCASEDGLCMVTPETEVFEENVFKVQACVNDECGVWSEELCFELTPPASAGAPRFTDNGDTVTDNKTKLMWSKNANRWGEKDYDAAYHSCESLTLARHSDWHLPSLKHLRSLIDYRQYDPALPPGHPFTHVQSHSYWSSTPWEGTPACAWEVDMIDGYEYEDPKALGFYVWPVRSDN